MMYANHPVLITGLGGFVGSNLKNYLLTHGYSQLSGTSRDPSNFDTNQERVAHVYSYPEVFKGDKEFTSYIHIAGKVYDSKEKSDPVEYIEANYQLSKDLFDSFVRDRLAEKFIFLSTIHVLAENPDQELDESSDPVPVTPYGESKLLAEQYMMENCPPGKRLYILRPCMIHGPGNKGNLNLLCELVYYRIPYPVGAFNNKRSFVSIDNLNFIIREILENDIEPGLYHIADDEPTYTHDLVSLIADTFGRKARIWNIPPVILRAMAKLGNITPFPLNDLRLSKLTGDFIVSNQKIKEAIQKPLPVSAKEGLRKTLESLGY